MKIYTKHINGMKLKVWNDSGASWSIQSTDKDGSSRTQHYDKRKMSMKRAVEMHSEIYSGF